MPADAPAPGSPGRGGRQVTGLAFGIGAPVAVYYLLHGLGVGNLLALAAGAALPALNAGYALASSAAPTA